MPVDVLQVFVSSTWLDLQPERQAVEAALKKWSSRLVAAATVELRPAFQRRRRVLEKSPVAERRLRLS
jgi:hypothetical protein